MGLLETLVRVCGEKGMRRVRGISGLESRGLWTEEMSGWRTLMREKEAVMRQVQEELEICLYSTCECLCRVRVRI